MRMWGDRSALGLAAFGIPAAAAVAIGVRFGVDVPNLRGDG
jgi:hypothetical protein